MNGGVSVRGGAAAVNERFRGLVVGVSRWHDLGSRRFVDPCRSLRQQGANRQPSLGPALLRPSVISTNLTALHGKDFEAKQTPAA